MVYQLITPEEEKRIFERLIEYYQKLYPNLVFSKKEKLLSKNDIGNIHYTYSGEETEATATETRDMIREALATGYNTTIILLEKKTGKRILLDGHRRAIVAYHEGLGWRVMIIQPNKDADFGIEKMIIKKVKYMNV